MAKVRGISVSLIAIALALIGPQARGESPPGMLAGSRPNVLLIVCDDLGNGDLGCQGHPVIRTPHLDRLATEGLRLTSCYSAAPVCSSSRAGLLTGRTPGRNGVYDWIPPGHPMHLRSEEITVATLLREAGYETCHVGKWHLNGHFNQPTQPQPGDHGFDHWFSTQNNAHPTHENPKNFVRNGERVGEQRGFSCQLVADEAIRWLDDHAGSDRPFFQYVCFHEPHEKVVSPPKLVASYLDEDGPPARNENEAHYFASVTNIDAAVGKLLAALEERDLAESTLVIFTSDNGSETLDRYPNATRSYGSPGPLRGMKLWLYEGGIRVPGIVRWPGIVEAGTTSDEPVCGVDILPTLCDLAGCEAPTDRPLDGTSIVSVFGGDKLRREIPLYWSYVNALGEPNAEMRIGDYMILGTRVNDEEKFDPSRENITPRTMKQIKSGRLGEFELYNVVEDVGQMKNLAESEPDRLRAYAERLVKRHRQVQAEGPIWEFPVKEQE